MLVKIIGLVIGISVASLGIYYLVNEKNDPNQRKFIRVLRRRAV